MQGLVIQSLCQFPHCKMGGDDNIYCIGFCVRIKRADIHNALKTVPGTHQSLKEYLLTKQSSKVGL